MSNTKNEINTTDFALAVYFYTLQIPVGKISTYKAIAQAVGNERASRAVGKALSINPYAPHVPCHRVVASDGKISGFFGSSADKIVQTKLDLLKSEGVEFKNDKLNKNELTKYFFSDFILTNPITLDSLNQAIKMNNIKIIIEKYKIGKVPSTITSQELRGMYCMLFNDCMFILNDKFIVQGKLPKGCTKFLVSLNKNDIKDLEMEGFETYHNETIPRVVYIGKSCCSWCKKYETYIGLFHGTGSQTSNIIRPLCEDCLDGYREDIIEQYYTTK